MPVITIPSTSKGLIPSSICTGASCSYFNQSVGSRSLDKTWVTTPNYKVKREKHALPMNPYYISRSENWRGQGFYITRPLTGATFANTTRTTGIGSGEYDTDFMSGSLVPSGSVYTTVQERAKAKLLADLKNQKVNLAQAYAERKRTAQLLSSTAFRFVAAFRALRNRNLEEALRILGAGPPSRRKLRRINAIWYGANGRRPPKPKDEFQNAAAVWLEIQYGWRPLMNDIYESAKEIIRATDQSPRKVKTTSSWTYDSITTAVRPTIASSKVSGTGKLVAKVRGTYVVWYSTPDVPRTLSQLGFMNPAYLAWELTPFSFVVDWFLPIGAALNAFDATLGLTFDKGCYSVKTNSSKRQTATGRTSVAHTTIGTATNFESLQRFQRTTILSFPSVTFPEFKNPFSVEHVLNGMALLVQVFSGRS